MSTSRKREAGSRKELPLTSWGGGSRGRSRVHWKRRFVWRDCQPTVAFCACLRACTQRSAHTPPGTRCAEMCCNDLLETVPTKRAPLPFDHPRTMAGEGFARTAVAGGVGERPLYGEISHLSNQHRVVRSHLSFVFFVTRNEQPKTLSRNDQLV